MLGFRYPTKMDKLQKPHAIRICHNLACGLYGSDVIPIAKQRIGTYIEFDFEDQIKSNEKDLEFARSCARQYGVSVKHGSGYVQPTGEFVT
jgi:hypothetical protein